MQKKNSRQKLSAMEETAAEALYRRKTKKSLRMYESARRFITGAQSHNARFFEPYPFYATKARGQFIWDIDQNKYTDYWMGHTALILGHSPNIVVKEIGKQASNGLLFGSPNKFAYELGELVSKTVPCAESTRFCTTGAEATMYAVRLARAFTKRKIVVKMAGGWHGYSSALTVGVSPPYDVPESRGLIANEENPVKLVEFNDIAQTERVIDENNNDIAAVIIEPLMGAGGVIPATNEYLQFLREKCDGTGIVLIFDEIITGFRLALGGAQEYYGLRPDLCTLGKILGGGLPVSAIAGRSDIMSLADTTQKSKTERCWIGGGTFSENALCMRAGIATISYLIKNKRTIYSKIGSLGDSLRNKVDRAFSDYGLNARSTGLGSLFATHFLSGGQESLQSPNDVNNSDREMERDYYFSLIAKNNIYFLPGHIGAISTVHKKKDIDYFVKSTEFYAQTRSRV